MESIHNMYMQYVEKKVGMESIALPIAEAIRTVVQTQVLTETETSQLKGLMADIVGDARLVEAYVGGDSIAIQKPLAEIDSVRGVGDNGNRITPQYRIITEPGFRAVLEKVLPKYRMSLDEFNELRLKNPNELTTEQKKMMKEIRESKPMPDETTLLQK